MKTLSKIAAISAMLATSVSVSTPAHASPEPFLGQLMTVGYNFCPRGWARADGQLLPISSNSGLFYLLGTTYGGDGRTTFGLPDLRGRSIVGAGRGAGLSEVRIGEKGGSERVTPRTQGVEDGTAARAAVGNSVTNRSPFTGMLTCIALQGQYPSRN